MRVALTNGRVYPNRQPLLNWADTAICPPRARGARPARGQSYPRQSSNRAPRLKREIVKMHLCVLTRFTKARGQKQGRTYATRRVARAESLPQREARNSRCSFKAPAGFGPLLFHPAYTPIYRQIFAHSVCRVRGGVEPGHRRCPAASPAILRIALLALSPLQFDASGGATSSAKLQPAAWGDVGLRDPAGRKSTALVSASLRLRYRSAAPLFRALAEILLEPFTMVLTISFSSSRARGTLIVARGNSCRIGSPPIGRICPL